MKKILSMALVLSMLFVLTACGGVPEEKLGEVDSIIAKLEVLVEDVKTEVEKTNKTGYDDVQKYYDETIVVVKDIDGIFKDIKKTWIDSKEDVDEETVDEFIVELKKLETQALDLKKIAVEEVAKIQTAIKEEEVKPTSLEVKTEITNNTGVDIYGLALSPANDDDWGENLISEPIKDGETVVGSLIFTADTLVWDILVEDSFENQLTFMGVDFSESSTDGATLALEVTESGEYVAIAK